MSKRVRRGSVPKSILKNVLIRFFFTMIRERLKAVISLLDVKSAVGPTCCGASLVCKAKLRASECYSMTLRNLEDLYSLDTATPRRGISWGPAWLQLEGLRLLLPSHGCLSLMVYYENLVI